MWYALGLLVYAIVSWKLIGHSYKGWKPGPGFNPDCNMCDWGLDYGFDNGCKPCARERGVNC